MWYGVIAPTSVPCICFVLFAMRDILTVASSFTLVNLAARKVC